jgi:hypothetical protein
MAKRRSATLEVDKKVELGPGHGVSIVGYDREGSFVCRLWITSAGIAVYAGPKGNKTLCNDVWERFVQRLSEANNLA